MVMLGIVKGQEIRENRNGGTPVRLLQVELSNASDVQTVQYMPMAGEDAPPQVGDKVAVLSIGTAFQVALGVQDSVTPSVEAGERKMYSRDGAGEIAAFLLLAAGGDVELNGTGKVSLSAGGDVELNGTGNSAVTFTPLDAQLQLLVAAINLALGSKLDGAGTPGALALDLSTAEAPTVKLP